MIRYLLPIMLFGSSLYAKEFSLFLTKEEQARYNKKEEPNEHKGDCLHLQAIMYTNDSNWCFWLNGEKITPHAIPASIRIKEVTEEHLSFIWKTKGKEIPVSLRVNERIDLNKDFKGE